MKCLSFPAAAGPFPRRLILGSMPGKESLRRREYYAFERNVFWRIMGELCDFSSKLPYPERLAALNAHGVALWDVLQYCEREGSLDAAIEKPVPNAVDEFLRTHSSVEKIGCNGGASYGFLRRFFPDLSVPVERLPSTSPAAAVCTYAEKLECWRRWME